MNEIQNIKSQEIKKWEILPKKKKEKATFEEKSVGMLQFIYKKCQMNALEIHLFPTQQAVEIFLLLTYKQQI